VHERDVHTVPFLQRCLTFLDHIGGVADDDDDVAEVDGSEVA